MITLHITADVKDDRQVVVTLPPEVPIGKTEIVVTIDLEQHEAKLPGTSLADWADQHAEDWGNGLRSADVGSFTGREF